MPDVDLSPLNVYRRLCSELPFEAQLINYARNPDPGDPFTQKVRYARQPRYKAAGEGLSRREIIRQFASRPANATASIQTLWTPFLAE